MRQTHTGLTIWPQRPTKLSTVSTFKSRRELKADGPRYSLTMMQNRKSKLLQPLQPNLVSQTTLPELPCSSCSVEVFQDWQQKAGQKFQSGSGNANEFEAFCLATAWHGMHY